MSKPLYFNDGILLTDNSATALTIKEGSNNYLTFITTNGSEKLSFGSTANPTFEVNGSFRQPLIAATTSFFSQTYSGATLSATNGAVNIESYSASKAGIVLNGSGDQITFTSPTLGFVGLVQVVGAITTDTSLNIASSTTVDGILDEDDMASNSATKLATQQSIKAYVDAQVGTVDTLAEILANGNTTGGTDIVVSVDDVISLDNGTNALPSLTTTGDLNTGLYFPAADEVGITTGGTQRVKVDSTGVDITGTASANQLNSKNGKLFLDDNGSHNGVINAPASLFVNFDSDNTSASESIVFGYDRDGTSGGTSVVTINSTGIDVTGTVTADGLTVDTDAYRRLLLTYPDAFTSKLQIGFSNFYVQGSATNDRLTIANNSSGQTHFENQSKTSMVIDNSGDISFYDSAGSSQSFYWDAADERLGIGTTLPSNTLSLEGSGTGLNINSTNDEVKKIAFENSGVLTGYIGSSTASPLRFLNGSGTELMRINSSGNVLINTASHTPTDTELVVSSEYSASGTTDGGITLSARQSGNWRNSGIFANGDALTFTTGDTGINGAISTSEKMRIDSSGNLLVGTDALTPGNGNTDTGHLLKNDGRFFASSASNSQFNRNSNGDILTFRESGVLVGSIGSQGGSVYVDGGASNYSLMLASDFRPRTSNGAANLDATVDLGDSGARFKDLYLSGAMYGGGVTSSSDTTSRSSGNAFSGSSSFANWTSWGTSTHVHASFRNGTSQVGYIQTTTTATSYNTSSDYRLKTDAQPMTGATDRLKQLNPVNFEWIADGTRVDGFLAHEAQTVVPEAVTGAKDAMRDEEYEVAPAVTDDDGNVVTEAVMGTRSVPDYQGIDQSKLVPLLVATIKELEARITALENA
jgi:hypothetical protein